MRRELRAMFTLAWPVVLAEMGWILMGIVDTKMVGPLGPAAIGAVGTGSILFMCVMMVGFGTLLALDTFIAQSYGAGRVDECHRWLFAGLHLAALLAVALTLLALGLVAIVPWLAFHPDVEAEIRPYLLHLTWSVAPLMAYLVFRRYLQAMHVVRPIAVALVAANLLNVVVNWLLIEGRWGFPRLGVVGAAYATVASRVFLAVFCFVLVWRRERSNPSGLHDVGFAIDWRRIRAIVTLGAPAAGQILLEVGVFAAAAALAGRITPIAVAAHTIVLNLIGFIFMIPYGIGTAAAVRVGHAVGRRDGHGVRRAGWAAIAMTLAVMTMSAALFASGPAGLIRAFSEDPTVVEVGLALMLIAALFQLFDGLQTVTTGALRGLGDTQTPMIWNLVGHWALGLPVAYWLCFSRQWGVQGLWAGLCAGLVVIGSALLWTWHRRSRAWLPYAQL
jgi:MATE family multidrug resistance protein